MSIANKIDIEVTKMPEGNTFKYKELSISREEYGAAAKALERLLKKGIIKRVSTGVFYKPKATAFGILQPKEEELLKPYLFDGGKRIAYITGTSSYNRMGLTTQVPKNIQVASRKRIVVKIGKIQVKAVKSYEDVTDDNYYLMELLDVIKDFKTIPDADPRQVTKYIYTRLENLLNNERDKLVQITLKYPPRVRAFVGALLSTLNPQKIESRLKESINPLTIYKLGVDKQQFPAFENWNIC